MQFTQTDLTRHASVRRTAIRRRKQDIKQLQRSMQETRLSQANFPTAFLPSNPYAQSESIPDEFGCGLCPPTGEGSFHVVESGTFPGIIRNPPTQIQRHVGQLRLAEPLQSTRSLCGFRSRGFRASIL